MHPSHKLVKINQKEYNKYFDADFKLGHHHDHIICYKCEKCFIIFEQNSSYEYEKFYCVERYRDLENLSCDEVIIKAIIE